MVAELVVGGGQHEDGFGATAKLRDVDDVDAVTLADLGKAKSRKSVIEIVDRGDGGQLPLKLVQN